MPLTPEERTGVRTAIDASFVENARGARRVLSLEEATVFSETWLVMYRSRAEYQTHSISCVRFLESILDELSPSNRAKAQAFIDGAPPPES